MALLLQELFLIAADLMFASALSCLFSALGCLVVPGLVGYVVFLSCGAGAMKGAKRSICQTKKAVLSMVSDSCVGKAAGKILDLVGLRGTAPLHPSEQAPILKEGSSSSLKVKQLPAGEKTGQKATKTLTGGRPSRAGMSRRMTAHSGVIWEEGRETSQADEPNSPVNQKKISTIPAFLLSLLFAPSDWCLKKRHFQWLATLLPTLKKSRD